MCVYTVCISVCVCVHREREETDYCWRTDIKAECVSGSPVYFGVLTWCCHVIVSHTLHFDSQSLLLVKPHTSFFYCLLGVCFLHLKEKGRGLITAAGLESEDECILSGLSLGTSVYSLG